MIELDELPGSRTEHESQSGWGGWGRGRGWGGHYNHIQQGVGNVQRYTPLTLYSTAPLYNIRFIIFDTVLRQKQNFEHKND